MNIKVSIIIKALNEQDNIAAAIESALTAVAAVGGEVIVADSKSTDKTIEIACRYPVKVVSLASADDRCCGVGAQLGFQHSRGDYLYILDGDMVLHADFISDALAVMEADPSIAGVGGRMKENNFANYEFEARAQRAEQHYTPGDTRCLNGGGLYRRTAIAKAGYLTNRNLHAYEEFELAARLRSLGYRLVRLDAVATDHFSHKLPEYALLQKRWKSGYIMGLGELIRGAVGKPYMKMILLELKEVPLYVLVLCWLASLMILLTISVNTPVLLVVWAGLLVLPVAMTSLRKRSFRLGIYAVTAWVVNALGMIRGLLRPHVPAAEPINTHIIKEPWKSAA